MPSLRVRVEELDGGTSSTYVFHRSPVRVGRGELNDLRLDYPYVSNWHGLVQFDQDGTRFVDLGSTNGSFLGGVRLERNVPAAVSSGHELLLGRLRLHLSLEATESEAAPPPRPVTCFARRVALDVAPGQPAGAPSISIIRPVNPSVAAPAAKPPPQVPAAPPPPPPQPSPAQPSPAPEDRTAAQAALEAAGWQLGVLHDACKQAADNFRTALDHALVPLTEEQRQLANALVAERFPHAPGAVPAPAAPPLPAQIAPVMVAPAPEPHRSPFDSGQAAPYAQGERECGVPADEPPRRREESEQDIALLRVFAEAYLGSEAVPASPDAAQALLAVIAEVLETAARGYLELRSGYEQFAREIGIRLPKGEGAIGRISDANQLVSWLLQPVDRDPRAQQLGSAFADLMIHQVGLLNGVQAGARALLERLSPAALTRELERKGGWTAGVRPLREAALWRSLEERYHELAEEENAVTDVLFGKEFARAYASLTGRRTPGDSDAGVKETRDTAKRRS
jgi:predicted component of type VI protein secretion system